MKPNSLLASRLKVVKQNIERACEDARRDPQKLMLVAVSKGQPFEAIAEAYNLGLRNFGESYAQEFSHKRACALAQNMADIRWHFIGAVQSNKIKTIAQAHVIQSIDNLRHAELLNQAASSNLEIFLQVNLSPAPGRRGFAPDDLKAVIASCEVFNKLKLRGLMTILPLQPERPNSFWFKHMTELRENLGLRHLELSMGMSSDYAEAITYGADVIRVGTSLFGARS